VLRNSNGDLDLKEDVANTCMEHGLHDLAAKTYRELLNKCGAERFYLHKLLGQALLKKGALAEAVAVMEKSAEKNGEDIEVLLFLARACLKMKHPDRAHKYAGRVIRIDPQNEEALEIQNTCPHPE
jgi:predicted Zn-dependent protease